MQDNGRLMVIENIWSCIQNCVTSTFSREPYDIGAAVSSLRDDKAWRHAILFLEKQCSPWLPMPCSSRAGSYMDMHGPLCVSAASVCQSFSACHVDVSAVSQWPLDNSGWNLCESGENLNRDGLQWGPCLRHNPSSTHLSLWLQMLTSLTWRVMSLMTTSLWSGWQKTR